MKRGFRVIDCDMHTIEPPDIWDRYLDAPFRHHAATFNQKRRRTAGDGPLRSQPEPHPHFATAAARGYDSASHLAAMDLEGIDISILFGTRGRHVQMQDDLDPALGAALAKAHNDWTYDFCATDPSRLKFAAQLSLHDPKLAAAETRRAVRQLGAVAVSVNPNPVNGQHIHDPCFEPLWEAIEELGIPVAFHPTGVWGLKDDIAQRFVGRPGGITIGNAARNPIESMLAFASLAGGGVLERHPRMCCMFLEATCGWLAWWLWRLDDTWERFGPAPGTTFGVSALPGEYFRRQCYIGADPTEKFLESTLEALGDDNIVIMSDYPHCDSSFPHTVDAILDRNSLSEATKAKLLWDNAAKVFARHLPASLLCPA